MPIPPTLCDIYWGSHGCSLEREHEGQHFCQSCCDGTEPSHQRHHDEAPASQYGVMGCAGTWPYYGEAAMGINAASDGLKFFHYSADNGWEFVYDGEEFERMVALHERRA